MTQPILQVSNLGKAYRQYDSELNRVASWFGFPTKPASENWVLRGISFAVASGEAVGIVGQNGAGKSTLLKLITGTQRPSQGDISINGRIAAILELGMGFNPEFTGRQNAYHAAGLMGFNYRQIERMVPMVEEFADIGEYFDKPVNIYSSGMQMRVAFALATSLKPQLLIVDEALSVGDAAFQRKCFRRLEEYLSEGMSLLLVSHDIESVKKICSKALFINNGESHGFGEAKKICEKYERYLFGSRNFQTESSDSYLEENLSSFDSSLAVTNELSYGDGRAVIEDVWLECEDGNRINVIGMGSIFYVKSCIRFKTLVEKPTIAFLIKTMEGISIYGTDTKILKKETENYKAEDRVTFAFRVENHLAEGTYFLNFGIKDLDKQDFLFIHRRVDVLMFRIQGKGDSSHAGLVNLGATFSAKAG